jgi:hypothetical protein
MGIDLNSVRFLLHAKSLGVDFARTATLGRQHLRPSLKRLRRVITTEFEHSAETGALEEIRRGKYADNLLKYLGAEEVDSFDASDYEGATSIHDFNQVIPERYVGRYTALLDAGSIEHVFNFPIAIKNCMKMLEVGGHFLGVSPTNNYMGHGFYQFSPELYFKIFSEQNGFQVQEILVQERVAKNWFRVADPDEVKSRVGFINRSPAQLFIVAQKTAEVPIFSTMPQQSFYTARWERDEESEAEIKSRRGSARKRGLAVLMNSLRRIVLGKTPDPILFKRITLARQKSAADVKPQKAAKNRR